MLNIAELLQIFWIASVLHVSTSQDTCSGQETEMTIARQMTVMHQGSVRTVDCTAHVTVKKCEGICTSNATPSANSETGIRRICSCCREDGVRKKVVPLDECYEGTTLLHGVNPMTSFTEPSACSCQDCRN